ncbi:hypothetical protein F4780DRAFT_777473 [Xylariomycetidae sp. FL0641]|nr:hypothetical protein F4780DRAFT_777473 [Xylariomycetidae sp. FL0641]
MSLLAGHVVGSQPFSLSRTTAAATRSSILIVIVNVLLLPSILAAAQHSQTLPYIPTSIFVPASRYGPIQDNDNATADIVYIFSPRDDTVDLLALNISTTLQASSLSLQTLTSGLPFLGGDKTTFAPSLTDDGSLTVYAGDCSSSTDSGIWTLDFLAGGDDATWTQHGISIADDDELGKTGPGFLGGAVSFSTTLAPQMSAPDSFIFGGMCPSGASTNASATQSRATYSNQMTKIGGPQSSAGIYTVESVEDKGPPVAAAGFTLTGLSPSVSNRSGTVTQQANYVLLGGHTQYAFVNMSTVAIWSLPEESWGYISDVGLAGSDTTNPELAIKSTAESIDSRSGHTAVLNEDGTKMIILGGWVGDLNQAASPQLAILEIGAGYGGDGDWQWSIPSEQPSGSGIYGHGAALLPGNVMMVYGGYSISSSDGKVKRSSAHAPTFLNLTSLSWSSDYANPSSTESKSSGDSQGLDDAAKKRLGLGLGLGLGLAAVLAALLLALCYRRRLRRRRESAIRALAQDGSRFLGDAGEGEMLEHEPIGAGWYMGGADPYRRGSRSLGYQSLAAGRGSLDGGGRHNWFGDLPPPPPPTGAGPIHRKPVPPRARGQYQPTPSCELLTTTTTTRPAMNPILEADDEDGGADRDVVAEHEPEPVPSGPAVVALRQRDSGAHLTDPFATPPAERACFFFSSSSLPGGGRASATPSPGERGGPASPVATDPEVQDWMTDVEAADALLSGRRGGGGGGGGHSRTGSNVSEPNRSAAPPPGRRNSLGRPDSSSRAADARGGSSPSSSAPSYNTARSSFPAMQAEGPGLLLVRGPHETDADTQDPEPGSPSKSRPLRRGWLGSLRRVFNAGPAATPSPSPPGTGHSGEEGGSSSSSPFREAFAASGSSGGGGLGGLAADGLLRRKGGRGAWEGAGAGGPSSSSSPASWQQQHQQQQEKQRSGWLLAGGRGAADDDADWLDDDEDWDIEKAVEKRLVQVLFTVPKERLRVVNAEPDVESGEDVVVVDPEDADDDEEDIRKGKGRDMDPEQENDDGYHDFSEDDIGVAITVPGVAMSPPFSPRSGPVHSPTSPSDDGFLAGGTHAEAADPEKEALLRDLDAAWTGAGHDALDAELEKLGHALGSSTARVSTPESAVITPATTESAGTDTPVVEDIVPAAAEEADDAARSTPRRPKKARSRVLAMVENIESQSRSREGSPAGSPVRGV